MQHNLQSDYYNKDILVDEGDLDILLSAYHQWCKENNQQPECNSTEEIIFNTGLLDHVLYHAEIYISENEDNPDFKLESIQSIFTEDGFSPS
jgi:hypothetical protein